MRTIYAIRQSSKGWSNIIAVVDTKELAERIAQDWQEHWQTPGMKTNFKVEEITYYGK